MPLLGFSKRGKYEGRLAFDPDSGFHTDPQGRKVITKDDGKTWVYARRTDSSHIARYQRRILVVTATTEADAHHNAPSSADLHVEGLTYNPDEVSEKVTSHTEAYRV